jgi:hypothetical protein
MSCIRDHILEEIASLPDEPLSPLVELIRAYLLDGSRSPVPLTGCDHVSRHAGVLTEAEAAEMLAVIEEDCERIDCDTW